MAITPEEARRELARRELERRRAAGQPEVTQEPEAPSAPVPGFQRSALRGAIGAADIASNAVVGFGKRLGAGVLAAPVFLDDPRAAEQIYEKYSQPPPLLTQQGQQFSEAIAPYAEWADTQVTDAFGALPGGPAVQAGARTAVQGPIELLGLRGVGALTKAARPQPPAPGTFIPSVKDLYAAGRVAFNEARLNGGGLRPEFLRRKSAELRNLTDSQTGLKVRFSERTDPVAAGLLRDILDDLDTGNISFDDLMELRQQAGTVAGHSEQSTRRLGLILKNKIDDIVESITPDDVISGDPRRAAQSLESANKFWRDASKAQDLETLHHLAEIDAGDFTGAGFENKLRIRFKQLARKIAQGKERGWTPEEIAAIEKVAMGGPVENVWRLLGKMAPTGIVSGGIGAGVGYTIGGPALAAAIPALGILGRQMATRSTIGNARSAMQIPLQRSLLEP